LAVDIVFPKLNSYNQFSILNAAKNEIVRPQNTKSVQLSDLVIEVKTKEKLDPDKLYRLVGVRWWGAGAFIREEKLGKEIKSKSLYKISPGLIIYNRLFAYRGSFAILENEHDGCYVSGEFPTFLIRDGIEEPEMLSKYIVYCLNSPYYLQIVDSLSTGSTPTSRNRLNQEQLLNIKVDIPVDNQELINLVELLDHTNSLREKQTNLLKSVKKMYDDISANIFTPT
jgi:hypothetical protein